MAVSRLLVGDRQRSPLEAVDEVLVVLTRSAEGLALGLHVVTSIFRLGCVDTMVVAPWGHHLSDPNLHKRD